MGTCKINKIDLTNRGILLDLSDEDYIKKMILTNKKVIISNSLRWGSNSRSLIYDKRTFKLIQINLNMFMTGLKEKNIVTVQRNYYDTLEV